MERFVSLHISVILLILILGCGYAAAIGSEKEIGGNQGWYVFHCHADGAEVSLDNDLKGTIVNGELSVPVYSTGTPYSRYTVRYDIPGYHREVTESLPSIPRKGESVNIYVDIEPVPTPFPTPTQRPIGGDQGWYDVYCNVNGASVSFDGVQRGNINGNVLVVPVYTTATPYSTITVSAPDYVPVTEEITRHPEKGETVEIYVTLNREKDNPIIMAPGSS